MQCQGVAGATLLSIGGYDYYLTYTTTNTCECLETARMYAIVVSDQDSQPAFFRR